MLKADIFTGLRVLSLVCLFNCGKCSLITGAWSVTHISLKVVESIQREG